jgi:hypothetical protein
MDDWFLRFFQPFPGFLGLPSGKRVSVLQFLDKRKNGSLHTGGLRWICVVVKIETEMG